MSLITDDPERSPRDCSRRKHHHHHHGRRRRRVLVAASSTVAALLLLLGLIVLWLTLLRPSGPHFSLLAATVSSNGSVVVVDAALTGRNPNAHAAALYDRLQASGSYAGLALRGSTPLEQPEAGEVVMSASLRSAAVGGQGQGQGQALLRLRIEGQLRWKVGAWVSGRHGLAVDCVAVVLQGSSSSSQSQCATHVLSSSSS